MVCAKGDDGIILLTFTGPPGNDGALKLVWRKWPNE
jgi:hypothetical protein